MARNHDHKGLARDNSPLSQVGGEAGWENMITKVWQTITSYWIVDFFKAEKVENKRDKQSDAHSAQHTHCNVATAASLWERRKERLKLSGVL